MLRILEKIKYIKDNYLIETIILVIIAIILINTLFVYPIVGKCDNGDFERFMRYGGLKNIHNEYKKIYDGYFHNKFLMSNPNPLLFVPVYINWVSSTILLKISVFIFLVIHGFSSNLFDIRYLAFVYCAIFLIGIFLIVSFKRFNSILKIICGAFFIVFFTSTCYITYFNSFFGEAGTIIFLFLNIGTYLYLITREKPEIRHFIYFFLASCGFLTAKSQNIPLLVFMLIIYAGLFVYYKQKKIRISIIIGTLIVISICGIGYFSLSDTMNRNNLYQSVFLGVLRDSPTPERDLQEIGIDKKFMVFYGHSFYDRKGEQDPLGKEMIDDFYPNISFGKILVFYINHPDRLWEKIVDSANNAYAFSNIKKGSFIKNQYDSNKVVNGIRVYLIEKFPKLHRNIYVFIGFSILYLLISIFYFIKYKDRTTRLLVLMLLFILASGASQLVLPVLGSGHGDFGKHLFLLNLSYDIMAGIAVLWIAHIIYKCSLKYFKNIILLK